MLTCRIGVCVCVTDGPSWGIRHTAARLSYARRASAAESGHCGPAPDLGLLIDAEHDRGIGWVQALARPRSRGPIDRVDQGVASLGFSSSVLTHYPLDILVANRAGVYLGAIHHADRPSLATRTQASRDVLALFARSPRHVWEPP